ncbi:MAG: flavodoxin family protein [Dehalococcoidales bacterium]|nr:flavodoxin family protein [Dehalococcoidales bacterium]
MKTLVVYDSIYGNTGEIAASIAEAIGDDAIAKKAGETTSADLESVELLIAGSPTYGGRPTEAMLAFLKNVSGTSLKNVKVAGFDTRLPAKWVKIFGFAAGKIEKSLKKLGGTPVIKPEGFFVTGTKGPLVANERSRAGEWAENVLSNISG